MGAKMKWGEQLPPLEMVMRQADCCRCGEGYPFLPLALANSKMLPSTCSMAALPRRYASTR